MPAVSAASGESTWRWPRRWSAPAPIPAGPSTIEWEPVEQLTAWRFGLATATGMAVPDKLLRSGSPQLRAFQARAPLLSADQRLDSARVAVGLGVFSAQSLVDLYSTIYDLTDPSDLPGTDAWRLREAFVGKDRDARLAAIRQLLGNDKDPNIREASRALVARAASLIDPDPKLEADAPELISAMLAAGYDQAAARWIPAVRGMKNDPADRVWAMLALSSANPRGLDLSYSRITGFIGRDKSPGKVRSALLVAGLGGLGRINTGSVVSLNRRYGLALGHRTSWTRMIDEAAARGQPGTVIALSGTGLPDAELGKCPRRASLPYPRCARAHRPGLHRPDDRRRGPVRGRDPRMDSSALVDRFLDMMAAEAGASRHTLAAYRNDLERAAEALGGSLSSARPADVPGWASAGRTSRRRRSPGGRRRSGAFSASWSMKAFAPTIRPARCRGRGSTGRCREFSTRAKCRACSRPPRTAQRAARRRRSAISLCSNCSTGRVCGRANWSRCRAAQSARASPS